MALLVLTGSDCQKALLPFEFLSASRKVLLVGFCSALWSHTESNLLRNCKINLINSTKVCNLIDRMQKFCPLDFFFIITSTVKIAGIRVSAGDEDGLCHQETTNEPKLHNKAGWICMKLGVRSKPINYVGTDGDLRGPL